MSYKALSDEKGDRKTTPKPDIQKFLEHGQPGSYMVASCNPIKEDRDAYQQVQPPHIQAKKCYEGILDTVGGRKLLITMEHNNEIIPKPVTFRFSATGCTLAALISSYSTIAESSPPRAGGFYGI